jgi:ethanolamine utilization protein EutS
VENAKGEGDMSVTETKQRIVQEYVPGKQITLAHIIRNPRRDFCERLGVDQPGAVGIMTITPGEGAIIAGDAATKAANIHVEFVDRFTGCLMFTGEVTAVETALKGAVMTLESVLGFVPAPITRT